METIKLGLQKYFWISCILFFIFSNQSKAQNSSNKAYIDFAEKFYQNMSDGKYDMMHACFDESLKKEIPLEDLKSNVQNMYQTYGKVIKKDSTILRSMAGYTVTIVPLHFEKKNLELRLALDKDKKIHGLFFTVFESQTTQK